MIGSVATDLSSAGPSTPFPVLSELQIAHAAAYIHRNPIDLMPHAALAAYRWSSYGVYLGRRSTPSWLTRSTIDALLPPDLHRELVARSLDPPGTGNITTDDIDAIVSSRINPQCPDGKRIRLLLGFDVAELTAADIASWLGLATAGAARTALARARSARRNDSALHAIITDLETQLLGANVTFGV